MCKIVSKFVKTAIELLRSLESTPVHTDQPGVGIYGQRNSLSAYEQIWANNYGKNGSGKWAFSVKAEREKQK